MVADLHFLSVSVVLAESGRLPDNVHIQVYTSPTVCQEKDLKTHRGAEKVSHKPLRSAVDYRIQGDWAMLPGLPR